MPAENLLSGRRILVMGLLDNRSIAWTIGTAAAALGAQVIYTVQSERFLTSFLKRAFKSEGLDIDDYDIRVCDVTSDSEIAALFDGLEAPLHGLVHSVAFANPATCLAETLFEAPREDVLKAFEVSAASLVFVAGRAMKRMEAGASIVALTFDSLRTYPNYNWMGICKSALESAARYLARDLGPHGIRVNCVSSGPLRTMAATRIPGFEVMEGAWPGRAPLGWDSVEDRSAVADAACYLLSDLSRRTTGEVLRVDGGFHGVAVALPGQGEVSAGG